jgi:hypothetical protein
MCLTLGLDSAWLVVPIQTATHPFIATLRQQVMKHGPSPPAHAHRRHGSGLGPPLQPHSRWCQNLPQNLPQNKDLPPRVPPLHVGWASWLLWESLRKLRFTRQGFTSFNELSSEALITLWLLTRTYPLGTRSSFGYRSVVRRATSQLPEKLLA